MGEERIIFSKSRNIGQNPVITSKQVLLSGGGPFQTKTLTSTDP